MGTHAGSGAPGWGGRGPAEWRLGRLTTLSGRFSCVETAGSVGVTRQLLGGLALCSHGPGGDGRAHARQHLRLLRRRRRGRSPASRPVRCASCVRPRCARSFRHAPLIPLPGPVGASGWGFQRSGKDTLHARPTAGPSAAPLLKRGVSQSGLSPRAVPLRSCRPWAPGRLLRGSPPGWPPTASAQPRAPPVGRPAQSPPPAGRWPPQCSCSTCTEPRLWRAERGAPRWSSLCPDPTSPSRDTR